MRRIRNTCLALLIGCCTPALVWAGVGSALFESRRKTREARTMVCRIDADCPPGFLCVNGRCMPQPENAA
jgi:hypothetical protein